MDRKRELERFHFFAVGFSSPGCASNSSSPATILLRHPLRGSLRSRATFRPCTELVLCGHWAGSRGIVRRRIVKLSGCLRLRSRPISQNTSAGTAHTRRSPIFMICKRRPPPRESRRASPFRAHTSPQRFSSPETFSRLSSPRVLSRLHPSWADARARCPSAPRRAAPVTVHQRFLRAQHLLRDLVRDEIHLLVRRLRRSRLLR